MSRVESKWVLVTGANGGIGRVLTVAFANAGYSVISTDISEQKVSVDNATALQLDLEQIALDESYSQAFKETVDDLTGGAGISALINNAAVQVLGGVKRVTRTDWQTSINVNLSAPLMLTQMFFESLEQNKGSVVNISSIHATQTKREFVAYATSKGALSSLTRNMAVDVGSAFRVNAIEPAAVDTEMLRAGFEGKEYMLKDLENCHPAGRISSAKEVAELALFLCSDAASFVHGACIPATGGIHALLTDPG